MTGRAPSSVTPREIIDNGLAGYAVARAEVLGEPVDRSVATARVVITRDRVAILATLLAIMALSWAYVLAGAGMLMMKPAVWTQAMQSSATTAILMSRRACWRSPISPPGPASA